MQAIEIKPDIYWVGAKDWDLRLFHGYKTQRGSTYNAYLIIDEKVVLVDTVKHKFYDEMLKTISSVIDPAKIDYIVSNHVEMDHSGSIVDFLKLAPQAKIFASPSGAKGLADHFGELPIQTVKNGEKINIGKRDMQFVHLPMIHWPDSMGVYLEQEQLLFPNDAFGQHYCSEHLFFDQCPAEIVFHEAAKYYANIVYPYGSQVQKILTALEELDIKIIAPSHGIIWRTDTGIEQIIARYKKWSAHEHENMALIIYDTMWGSTEKIAQAICETFDEYKIPVAIKSLTNNHYSDVITDVLKAKYIALGSPTLNNQILPTMAAFLTYIKGLRPRNKTGFVFGSHGWAPRALDEVENVLKGLQWELPVPTYKQKYVPKNKDLDKVREAIAKIIKTSS